MLPKIPLATSTSHRLFPTIVYLSPVN